MDIKHPSPQHFLPAAQRQQQHMYSVMNRLIGRSRCHYRLSHAAHLRQQQHQDGAQMIPLVGQLSACSAVGSQHNIFSDIRFCRVQYNRSQKGYQRRRGSRCAGVQQCRICLLWPITIRLGSCLQGLVFCDKHPISRFYVAISYKGPRCYVRRPRGIPKLCCFWGHYDAVYFANCDRICDCLHCR